MTDETSSVSRLGTYLRKMSTASWLFYLDSFPKVSCSLFSIVDSHSCYVGCGDVLSVYLKYVRNPPFCVLIGFDRGRGVCKDGEIEEDQLQTLQMWLIRLSELVCLGEQFKLCWCVQVWVSGKNICWMRTKPSLVWLLGEVCSVVKIITKIWIYGNFD